MEALTFYLFAKYEHIDVRTSIQLKFWNNNKNGLKYRQKYVYTIILPILLGVFSIIFLFSDWRRTNFIFLLIYEHFDVRTSIKLKFWNNNKNGPKYRQKYVYTIILPI